MVRVLIVFAAVFCALTSAQAAPGIPIPTPPRPELPHPRPDLPMSSVCRSSCAKGVSKTWFAEYTTTSMKRDCPNGNPDLVTPCGAYTCNSNGRTCHEECSTNAECAAGHACTANQCVSISYSCSGDNKLLIGTDGRVFDCGYYLCSGTACLNSCGSTSDCAGGSCDITTRTCSKPN